VDFVQSVIVASLVIAIPLVAQFVAAMKNVHEIGQTRIQRALELRWRKAEMAKKVLDEIWFNPRCQAALTMVDWDGRSYQDSDRRTHAITHRALVDGLRTHETRFTPDEQFIRDCFDALFDGVARIEHFIRTGLIEFEDVEHRWRYYVGLFADFRPVMQKFVDAYGYEMAGKFFDRFAAWRQARTEGEVTKRRGVHRWDTKDQSDGTAPSAVLTESAVLGQEQADAVAGGRDRLDALEQSSGEARDK